MSQPGMRTRWVECKCLSRLSFLWVRGHGALPSSSASLPLTSPLLSTSPLTIYFSRPPSHWNLQSNLVKQMWQIILLFLFCKRGWRRTKFKGLFSPVRKKQRKDFNLSLPSSKSTAISTMQYIYALSRLALELQIIIFERINLKGPRVRTGIQKAITIRKNKSERVPDIKLYSVFPGSSIPTDGL